MYLFAAKTRDRDVCARTLAEWLSRLWKLVGVFNRAQDWKLHCAQVMLSVRWQHIGIHHCWASSWISLRILAFQISLSGWKFAKAHFDDVKENYVHKGIALIERLIAVSRPRLCCWLSSNPADPSDDSLVRNQTKVNDGASSGKDAATALDKVSEHCEFSVISMSLKLKRPKFVKQTKKKCKYSLSMLGQITQLEVQCFVLYACCQVMLSNACTGKFAIHGQP